mgnify:FL=1
MDIASHALWVVAGAFVARRALTIAPRTIVAAAMAAVLPDLIHLLPVVSWVLLGSGTIADLYAYAVATPGEEPAMPAIVAAIAHHLHCTLHSAVVAAPITLFALLVRRAWWLPLLAWWSHILIDVLTHSDDYYASPFLYPITYWGFDGLAWNRPAFLAINYALLVIVYIGLYIRRGRNKAL